MRVQKVEKLLHHDKDQLKNDPLWLFEKMLDKAHDLSHAILHAEPNDIRKRAADVSAYASLIADTAASVTRADTMPTRR